MNEFKNGYKNEFTNERIFLFSLFSLVRLWNKQFWGLFESLQGGSVSDVMVVVDGGGCDYKDNNDEDKRQQLMFYTSIW